MGQLPLEVMLDLKEDIIKLLNMFLIRLKIILRNNFYIKEEQTSTYASVYTLCVKIPFYID